MFNSFFLRKRQRSYAHTQVLDGCPWDEETCENAAAGSHVECLKYAYLFFFPRKRDKKKILNGCPWDSSVCDAAAVYWEDDKEKLKYAYENGCDCIYKTEIKEILYS